jgi:hypothetical protein
MQVLFRRSDIVNLVYIILKLDSRIHGGLDLKVRLFRSEGD